MINIIKMDFYRLFHSLSFWIISLIMVCMVGTSIMDMYDNIQNFKNDKEAYEEELKESEEEGDVVFGVSSDVSKMATGRFNIADCMESIYAGNTIQVLMMILIIIFICNENDSGYIKNIINVNKHRWYGVISKTLIGGFVVILFNLVSMLIYAGSIGLFFHDATVDLNATTLSYIGTQMLLSFGFGALMVMLSTVIRGKVGSLIAGFVITVGLIPSMLAYLLNRYLHISNDVLKNCMITMKFREVSQSSSNSVLVSAVLLGIIASIVYTAIGGVIFSKRDV